MKKLIVFYALERYNMDQFEVDIPDQPFVPVIQEFPMTFCVRTIVGQREGYYLLRWTNGGFDNENKRVHVLKPGNHLNRFYNVHNYAPVNTATYNIITRKSNGNINRPISWRYTNNRLSFHGLHIPVIHISPMNALPSIKPTAFIPITEPVVPLAQPKIYPITKIPQHGITALLRDAAFHEVTCPITSVDIDVSNGAITSCFHIFEKSAIKHWLSLPSSKEKCPLCNNPCNSYTLD